MQRIQMIHGLIEEQHIGVLYEQSRERQPLSFTTRTRSRSCGALRSVRSIECSAARVSVNIVTRIPIARNRGAHGIPSTRIREPSSGRHRHGSAAIIPAPGDELGDRVLTGAPLQINGPSWLGRKPAIVCSVSVLPTPFGPRMQTNAPGANCRSRS